MKTVTYDPSAYKLVPVEPTIEMIYAADATECEASWKSVICELLAAVPDQLPGVVEHSGEPIGWRLFKDGMDYGITSYNKEDADELRREGYYVICEVFTHPAPSQPSGHNVTILKSVWESWQTWGNAWFSVCAALTEAWPSWNMAKGKNAIQAACDMIRQLGAWENARRSASQPSAEQPWHERIRGMEISVDISTGEGDADHRIYGRVNEVMLAENGAGVDTILAEEEGRNFTQPSAEALVQAALEAAENECDEAMQALAGQGDGDRGSTAFAIKVNIRALSAQQIIESCKEKP